MQDKIQYLRIHGLTVHGQGPQVDPGRTAAGVNGAVEVKIQMVAQQNIQIQSFGVKPELAPDLIVIPQRDGHGIECRTVLFGQAAGNVVVEFGLADFRAGLLSV